MLLQYLVEEIEKETKGNLNIEINKIEYDSKRIEKGDLFIALRGERFDGAAFISEARNKGAWVLSENDEADLKVNSLFSVKFHSTERVSAIRYLGVYGQAVSSLSTVNANV